jgi:hypothetical protein
VILVKPLCVGLAGAQAMAKAERAQADANRFQMIRRSPPERDQVTRNT